MERSSSGSFDDRQRQMGRSKPRVDGGTLELTGPQPVLDPTAMAIMQSELRWRALLRDVADVITVIDGDGTVKYTTGQTDNRVLGYSQDFWATSPGIEMIHPDDRQKVLAEIEQLLTKPGGTAVAEFKIRDGHGDWQLLEAHATNLMNEPSVQGIALVTRNVTEARRSERLMAAQLKVLESIATSRPLVDVLTDITTMIDKQSVGVTSAVFECVADGSPELATTCAVAIDQQTTPNQRSPFWAAPFAAARTAEIVIIKNLPSIDDCPTGQLALGAPLSAWAYPVRSSDESTVLAVIGSYCSDARGPSASEIQVITLTCRLATIAIERARASERLTQLALHDSLTGLPNRSLFVDRAGNAIDRARRTGDTVVVMFLDLDRFKSLNDTLGHAAGDRLLSIVSERLRAAVRPGDTVARLGGDEFVVLCERISSRHEAGALADRLCQTVRRPVAIQELEFSFTTSIGVAISRGEPGQTAETLLRDADGAMYKAKAQGRNIVRFADSGPNSPER